MSGLPKLSASCATSGSGKLLFAPPDWLSPEDFDRTARLRSALPVAVNVIGLPMSGFPNESVAIAATVLVPAAVPSLYVTLVWPLGNVLVSVRDTVGTTTTASV